jgi:hypothetical protein
MSAEHFGRLTIFAVGLILVKQKRRNEFFLSGACALKIRAK